MNELLQLIDTRQVTEVVATRIDRLGRDASATDSLIILAGAGASPSMAAPLKPRPQPAS